MLKFNAHNEGREELEDKIIRKFHVELQTNRRVASYNAEYLCADGEFKLVLTYERQFIGTKKETSSIFIKSCSENVTVNSSLLNYRNSKFFSSELNNTIDKGENHVPIIQCNKLEIFFADLKILTLKTKHDAHKICNFLSDDTTSIAKDYQTLMNNKDSSDVTIIIGDKKFPCHKLILTTRSKLFARMLQADMLEKQKGLVTIEDVNPKTFELLLKYIYTCRLDETEIKDVQVDWVELMVAAEKYDIDGLKKVCWKNITGNLSIDNAIDALILADWLNQPELKKFTAAFIHENRDKIVDTEKYKELISKNNKLAQETLELMLKSPGKSRKRKCKD